MDLIRRSIRFGLCLTISAAFGQPVAPTGRLEREARSPEERAEMAKVQVVLDRSQFRPGRIDGLGGEFTQKAAERFNRSRGLPPESPIDTSHLATPYREYEVQEMDLEWIGRTASTPPEQQKLRRMPYADAWEMVAEMFHCELKFLSELNPDLDGQRLEVGSILTVPDVEPFRMADVEELERARRAPKPTDQAETAEVTGAAAEPAPTPMREPQRHIVLLTQPRILELYEDDRLVASYPCTPGSARVPVPEGTWRITSNVLMPYFRYDASVLRDGTRSDHAYNIPPGPNNYVGIVWLGVNRPSVGIHGTQHPDQIGRNESSGCIRLANWDAFDLARRAPVGTPVIVKRRPDGD